MSSPVPSTPKAPRLNPGLPLSPLGNKRLRLASGEAQFVHFTPPPLLPLPTTPFRFSSDNSNTVVENETQPTPPMDRTEHSNALLHAEAHGKRKAWAAKEQEDKGTKTSYERHFTAYQLWWSTVYQPMVVATDPTREHLPALPITAAKVTMFLDYESTRPKVRLISRDLYLIIDEPSFSVSQCKQGRRGETIPDSFLGRSHLKQVISALEYYRLRNQSDYPGNPEAQRALRSDERIRQFEDSVSHDEPKRVEKSQALKAAGTIAGALHLQPLYTYLTNDSTIQIPTQHSNCLKFRCHASHVHLVQG